MICSIVDFRAFLSLVFVYLYKRYLNENWKRHPSLNNQPQSPSTSKLISIPFSNLSKFNFIF